MLFETQQQWNMREWRNWQTRTFEGRVVNTIRVQVPSLAPNPVNSDGVLIKRMWRNWQTRMVQVHVNASSCRFKSCYLHQKRSNFCLPKVTSFFIQAAGLAYHHRAKRGAYHQPLWGCISSRVSVHPPAAWWDATLRVDDIPQLVADDIQGFALILYILYAIIPSD